MVVPRIRVCDGGAHYYHRPSHAKKLGLPMERHCVMLEQSIAEFAHFSAEIDAEFVI